MVVLLPIHTMSVIIVNHQPSFIGESNGLCKYVNRFVLRTQTLQKVGEDICPKSCQAHDCEIIYAASTTKQPPTKRLQALPTEAKF